MVASSLHPTFADEPTLVIENLSKTFAGTHALSDVSLSVRRGEVLALVGENGAGKSTLVKSLAGLYHPDSGSIRLRGEALRSGPHSGIAFLHQELGLVESMTVAENIALGLGYAMRHGLISWRETSRRCQQVLGILGITIDPSTIVGDLSRADRSLVALARCLAAEPALIVLDEPTASLVSDDAERLFRSIDRLCATGVSAIFVSHRMDEIFRVANRVAVLRNGRLVDVVPTEGVSANHVVELMVGRPPGVVTTARVGSQAPVVLQMDSVATTGLGPIDLRARAGEILGIVGLRGSGQELVAQILSGQLRTSGGTVTLGGRAFDARSPARAFAAGVAYVTGNREADGMAPGLAVRENLFMNPRSLGRRLWSGMTRAAERRAATEVTAGYDVRPNDVELPMMQLSGGNQQKVILARALTSGHPLFLLEDPTLGVDVGAREAIYRLLGEAVSTGSACVLVTSDFEEVATVASRALVMYRGRIVADVSGSDMSAQNLLRIASNATDKEVSP
jgi:ribose transport system ATP-binding protein